MIPDIRGEGRLLLDGDVILAGTFEISHDLNRGNGLEVAFLASGDSTAGFHAKLGSSKRKDLERRLALEGETGEGYPVAIERLLIAHRTLSSEAGQPTHTTLRLLPRTPLSIGVPPEGISAVHLLCPNLIFGGKISTRKPDGGFRRDTVLLETNHNGREVRFKLRQLPGYEDAALVVRQTANSEWTARLTVEATDGFALEVNEASSLANDFLLLLSFALSRRALWVSLEVVGGSISYREVRYGTPTNLKAFPGSVMGDGDLIAGDGGFAQHPLSEFMEVALPAFWSLSEPAQRRLQEAIECMCESIARFFSPATITLTGRAFEALFKGFLGRGEKLYLSRDSGQDKALKTALREKLDEFGALWANSEKGIAAEWQEQIDGLIGNLLRRPLRMQMASLLDRWLTQTGNPYDAEWPKQFVKARNAAAHYSPVGQGEFDAWVKGITLLSRVILKILGYSGAYLDFYGDGAAETKWSIVN